MKKGFTLIELIGVVIVLATISILVFPSILNKIKEGKIEISEANKQLIYAEANRYIANKEDEYRKTEGNVYCIQLRDLAKEGNFNENMYDGDIDSSVTLDKYVKVTVNNSKYELEISDSCEVNRNEIYYKTESLVYTDGECDLTKAYEYMGGCYLKAQKSITLKNHIWYNGFLWRIMGITSDGSVRMVTEENVTTISYNVSGNIDFNGSHADNWLNDYFYNKLSNENNLKTNIIVGEFCQGEATTISPSRTNCTGGTILTRNVGLLSIDEYNLAGGSNSYLNATQSFRTISPSDSANMWYVFVTGSANKSGASSSYGLRPVINVNSNAIVTGGNGTLGNFYILVEYKNETTTIENLSGVKIGEYVSLNDKIYRVVENRDTTKLIFDGYYQEGGTNFTMAYGDDNVFTQNDRIATESDTLSGIGYKLNTDVLNWLTDGNNQEKLKSIIVTSNWYQNKFSNGNSYTVSLDETSTPIEAQVGLIRVGEMLSSQSYSILTKNGTVVSNYSNPKYYWTLTQNNTNVWYIYHRGDSSSGSVSSTYALRPVINIDNSLVTITSGNGLLYSPYVIEPK